MADHRPKPKGELEAAHGAAFKAARTAKSWTLVQIAEALGVGINSVRWHEAGAVIMPPDKVIKAARLLGASPDALGATYRAAMALGALSEAAKAEGLVVAVTGRKNGHAVTLIAEPG